MSTPPQPSTDPRRSDVEFDVSARGRERLEAHVQEFREMLLSTARAMMTRRRSQTLDEADASDAYKELVGRGHPAWLREIVGGIAVMAAGSLFGYGSSLVVEGRPGHGLVWLAGGVLLASMGMLFQHFQRR